MVSSQANTPQWSGEEEYKKLLELRKIRGYSILAKGDVPTIVDEENFFVPSQSDKSKRYRVTHLEGWTCECPDYTQRKIECKHIQAIRIFLKVRGSQDAAILELKEELNKEAVNCSFCGSDEVMKRGKRKTATGTKQRYKCKSCNRRFVPDIVKRTKVDAKMITFVMDLYYKGLSLRDIKDSVKQFFSVDLHHETIRQYVLKFSKQISEYTDQFKPQVSNRLQIDEQKLKTKSEKEWKWCWNVIDEKTRFLLANNITNERSIFEASIVLDKVKPLIKKPVVITTDKLASYKHAIATILPQATHLSGVGLQNEHNNNTIERYHNSEREFDKIRRGFDKVEEWQAGHRLFHNYIRENRTLGKTPAQAAAIELTEGNKWMSLLKKSTKVSEDFQKNG